MRVPLLCSVMLFTLAGSAAAQQRAPLVTDRPDQTESAVVVPAGWVQIEAGFLWESVARRGLRVDGTAVDDAEDGTYSELPGLLLRIGVSEAMELRVGSGYARESLERDPAVFDPTDRGFGAEDIERSGTLPLSLGLKAHLLTERGWIPQSAVIATVTMAGTGGSAFDAASTTQEIRLAFAHTISDIFSLGYNLGLASGERGEAHAGLYTIALGAGITEALGLYVESYGEMPGDAHPVHRFDAGATFLLTPDLQLDASAGLTLDEDDAGLHWRSDHFFSAGVSWRFRVSE